MAVKTYSFTLNSNQLSVTGSDGTYETYMHPSVILTKDSKIWLHESGIFKQTFSFRNLGEINGDAADNIQNGFVLIRALISGLITSMGTAINYNTENIYDESDTLPLEFDSGTIHSYSILCKTGTTTITVNGNTTILVSGQTYSDSVSTTFDGDISVDSTTGTFLLTVVTL